MRFLIYLIIVFYCGNLFTEPLHFTLDCEAALLMNASNGKILFEKESEKKLFPASTTKIATALYVLKFHSDLLDTKFKVEQECIGTLTQEKKSALKYVSKAAFSLEPDATHIQLKVDEEMTLLNLLEGMLIPSGNDAANVIAHAIGPTVPVFMDKLNTYLKDIGCLNTVFYNPHGLHHPDHQTTAYDLALLSREALKESVFCDIVKQVQVMRPKTNKQAAYPLLQGNRLLRAGPFYYSKAIGVKTGYHSKSRHTFVGAAQFEGRTLIAVLLGYKDRKKTFADAKKMFETAFNQPKITRTFLKAGEQPFSKEIEQASKPLKTKLNEPLTLDYYPAEDPHAKCLLYWQLPSLPIDEGQLVGELHLVSKEGVVLKKTNLLAAEAVARHWLYQFTTLPFLVGLGAIFLFLIVYLLYMNNGNNRPESHI